MPTDVKFWKQNLKKLKCLHGLLWTGVRFHFGWKSNFGIEWAPSRYTNVNFKLLLLLLLLLFILLFLLLLLLLFLLLLLLSLENTVQIEPQQVALDFKNLSQYSSRSKKNCLPNLCCSCFNTNLLQSLAKLFGYST